MTFENLKIYQLSFLLHEKIYEATFKFPKEEIYGLTSQLRRASISIFSNIAEGYGRGTNKDFRNFLHNSKGSLYEVQAQISSAKRWNYISNDKFKEITSLIEILKIKLNLFIKNIQVN